MIETIFIFLIQITLSISNKFIPKKLNTTVKINNAIQEKIRNKKKVKTRVWLKSDKCQINIIYQYTVQFYYF